MNPAAFLRPWGSAAASGRSERHAPAGTQHTATPRDHAAQARIPALLLSITRRPLAKAPEGDRSNPIESTVSRGVFQVFKSFLQSAQLTAAESVEQAARCANDISQFESRGPGDLENAWHRVETKYGIPASLFWSLRYRKPKQIAAHHFARLLAAREDIAARKLRAFTNGSEGEKDDGEEDRVLDSRT